MVSLHVLPLSPPSFERLSSNFSCPRDTCERALSLDVDCPLIPFILESAMVVVQTKSWRECWGLGFAPYIPGYGKKGRNALNSHIPLIASHLWTHLTQSASRCWVFKQWIEGAAWLSTDFQPSKLGLWSPRTASNKNQFPLYSKESS